MTNLDSPPEPGALRDLPSAASGLSRLAEPTSESPATISGCGIPITATTANSKPSKGRAVKVSPARQGLDAAKRAKTTIAICSETISGALDQVDTPTKIMALNELIRRLRRRLETEEEKIAEAKRHAPLPLFEKYNPHDLEQ